MNYPVLANLIFKGNTLNSILNCSDLQHIVTVNAEYVVTAQENTRLKAIINSNVTTVDGQLPFWLLKLKNKNKPIEKISGSDFIYEACELAKRKNYRVFLLGGKEESNIKAVEKLKLEYEINIDGFSPEYQPYPFSEDHNKLILDRIYQFQPHIVFVGFGIIKQDFWIDDNKEFLRHNGVKIVVGSGGTFEFVAGDIKRAPKCIQSAGLEGVWRFVCEPKIFRLKRILKSFKIFKYI